MGIVETTDTLWFETGPISKMCILAVTVRYRAYLGTELDKPKPRATPFNL